MRQQQSFTAKERLVIDEATYVGFIPSMLSECLKHVEDARYYWWEISAGSICRDRADVLADLIPLR